MRYLIFNLFFSKMFSPRIEDFLLDIWFLFLSKMFSPSPNYLISQQKAFAKFFLTVNQAEVNLSNLTFTYLDYVNLRKKDTQQNQM